MKLGVLLLAVPALLSVANAAHAGSRVRDSTSPLIKVVEMLDALIAKGKEEKQAEKVEFAKFGVYCKETRESTTEAIQTAGESIVQLKADIGKALSDAEVLAEEIKDLNAEVAKEESELAEATKIRKKEEEDYKAAHEDLTESIDAIERATKVIKKKSKDVPQSLLQLQQSNFVSAEDKANITSFIALSKDAAPEALAYESQTGGVVAILDKLKIKFVDQLTTLEKEEQNSKANFELLAQKLTDSIKDGKDTISDKTTKKAERQEAAAEAKGELEATTKAKAADEKKLETLDVECDAASKEYEQNQVTRAEEIKAMETCKGILTSDKVAGTAKKNDLDLAQTDSATSFAQLRSTESKEDNKRRRVVAMLQRRANALKSRYLSLVADRAVADPFVKVRKMIKDMIVKLMEEANAEADQKGYCDKELATNKVTREGKSSDVEELTAQVEKLEADLAKMTQEIADTSKEIAEIKSEQKKATELRDEEKALNTKTIIEAKEAQVAVERATQVMKEFYAKAAKPALIQDASSDEDSLSEEMQESASDNEPYQGMQAASGGLIGMLEVILSDFARLESQTSTAEDEQANKYHEFMQETTTDADVKGVDLEHLEKKAEVTGETVRNLKKELKATQEELDAALKYYEKLKPDCVDTGLSYQDRVEMRAAEIQSLQEAYKVLSEES